MGEISSADHDGQRVTIGRVISEGADHLGFQYHWRDQENREWITEIVGCHNGHGFLVGIHLFCQTSGIGVRIPPPKKPYIAKQILDELGGDMDGFFQASDSPHLLSESEVGVAERLLTSSTDHHLPLIYVSCNWRNEPPFDVGALAKWVSGMAHVVVEPSRRFSVLLAEKIGRNNPYGGAVSINWPRGGGPVSRFFPYRFDEPFEFANAISVVVRKALAARRPDPRVTWGYIRELILRERIVRLKKEGTAGLEDYILAFDEEVKLTKERANALEEENSRLKRELSELDQYSHSNKAGLLVPPKERELFPGEHIDILVRALRRAAENSQPDGRARDVIEAFLESNNETGESSRIESAIKSALGNCTNVGKEERKSLEEIGFSFSEEGKHYKLLFRGDDRYTFAMAKTASDWRGIKNWTSDVIKRLFK